MDLQPTNTTVEMDCATGGHVIRNNKYINPSDKKFDKIGVEVAL